MTNVAARNQAMKTRVLQAFDTVYSCVVCMPLNEDLNDIVVGMNQCRSDGASTAGQSALKVDDGQSPTDTSIYLEDTQCDSLGDAPLSSLHTQTSSSNGRLLNCVKEDVKGRVSELVKVIRENRGDVEELESRFMTSIKLLLLYIYDNDVMYSGGCLSFFHCTLSAASSVIVTFLSYFSHSSSKFPVTTGRW